MQLATDIRVLRGDLGSDRKRLTNVNRALAPLRKRIDQIESWLIDKGFEASELFEMLRLARGMIRHHPFDHDTIKKEQDCEECANIKKIDKRLSSTAQNLERQLQVEKLRDTIRFHAHLYYNLNTNEISDYAYDKLVYQLKQIEKECPGLVTSDSPTQLVGEAISAPLRKRK